MNRAASVVYTIFVIVVLMGVIGFLGWETRQTRIERTSDFLSRSDDYARRLTDTLVEERDVNQELELARSLQDGDPSLLAVQVYSHDDGLRVSAVVGAARDFSRVPLIESAYFSTFPARLRYHQTDIPMMVDGISGLEATFVTATLTDAEIRETLMIILVTVLFLFTLTFILLLIKPAPAVSPAEKENSFDEKPTTIDEGFPFAEEEGFDLPDIGESEPAAAGPDEDFDDGFGTEFDADLDSGLDMGTPDDDFSLPEDFDDEPDFPADIPDVSAASNLQERLDSELDRAAAFNQDLSLLIFSKADAASPVIRDVFDYEDLLFAEGDEGLAVIELNRDLDGSISKAESVLRDLKSARPSDVCHVGISSRNGRLLNAADLIQEAHGALRRTDDEKSIVAFRSDPEKYREFLREQDN